MNKSDSGAVLHSFTGTGNVVCVISYLPYVARCRKKTLGLFVLGKHAGKNVPLADSSSSLCQCALLLPSRCGHTVGDLILYFIQLMYYCSFYNF